MTGSRTAALRERQWSSESPAGSRVCLNAIGDDFEVGPTDSSRAVDVVAYALDATRSGRAALLLLVQGERGRRAARALARAPMQASLPDAPAS